MFGDTVVEQKGSHWKDVRVNRWVTQSRTYPQETGVIVLNIVTMAMKSSNVKGVILCFSCSDVSYIFLLNVVRGPKSEVHMCLQAGR